MTIPPFCPNERCSYHQSTPKDFIWYLRDGHYSSQANGIIQRFRCKHCGSRFSAQTFSLDFHVKRRISYRQLFFLLITSSGIRDMGRILHASTNCITNRISRLARQAIAIHADLLGELCLNEDLVADGFESFAVSQYFPNNIQLLAGKESQYWICSDYAHLRRKGRMSPYQKQRNRLLQAQFTHGRVTVYESFSELLKILQVLSKRSGNQDVTLYTDKHNSYREAVGNLSSSDRLHLFHKRISSKLPRSVSNELFSVNYLDREIRKDLAEHTRETVQFGRNVVNQMERLAIYRVYHNYFKPFRIRGRDDSQTTHAEKAGIPSRSIQREVRSFFTHRRFLSRINGLMYRDIEVWLKRIRTPLKINSDELPAYTMT